MNKRLSILVLILSATLFAASGFVYQANQTTPFPTEPKEVATTSPTLPEIEIVPTVSLEEKVGQLFIIGHWADSPLASTTNLIRKHHLGGVVIMSSPANADDIKNWTSVWNKTSHRPLFIAIDQEGGQVSRLKGSAFIQTRQRDITNVEAAYEIGRTRGVELEPLGINMNFAPVLDSATNPNSFMYDRTFPTKASSAVLASAMIQGMKEVSLIGVIKHFPGHDDTADDSHNILPTVNIERAELDTFASQFRELINDQEPAAIMTAHILFPNIDTEPASLSLFFLTDYLRDELGYNGLIITDDMSMKAITDTWNIEEASILALQSGADIVLFAAEPNKTAAALTAVIAAVETGQLSEERITESYERAIALKEKIK
ncbi:MAG: beta-N-acetylhexosaminidase [Candidatus Paceibacteria bacterium]|jgi:beta-N-acetylhexosaminidase